MDPYRSISEGAADPNLASYVRHNNDVASPTTTSTIPTNLPSQQDKKARGPPPDDTARAPPSARVNKEKPPMVRLIPSSPPTYVNDNEVDNRTVHQLTTEFDAVVNTIEH